MTAAIAAIRARRAEMNVPPSKKAQLFIKTAYKDTFASSEALFVKMASASSVTLTDAYEGDNAVSIVTDAATIYIPLADMVDFEKERKRLSAELDKVRSEIARGEAKLANEGFTAKAPAAVVEAERGKLQKAKETEVALIAAIDALQ